MRVLVTGAAGIIGRATVTHLLAEGIAVSAASIADAGEWPRSVRALVIDATSESAVADALDGCDAVVHLAALAHPSLGTPRTVFANNVVSTFTVLAQAAERGITRAVIASSINAFGVSLNPHAPMPAYFPLDEELPADLGDAYSLSKLVDELSAGMAARAWGMDVVALRFPLVKSRAELVATAATVDADPASMMRTGWAYLTVDDAARAILLAVQSPPPGANVIGLSAVDSLLDRPSEELLDSYAPGVPRRRRFSGTEALIDQTRAHRLLGFRPTESIHVPTAVR
jgi:nucleoside-diphosphate-sugar epimerase